MTDLPPSSAFFINHSLLLQVGYFKRDLPPSLDKYDKINRYSLWSKTVRKNIDELPDIFNRLRKLLSQYHPPFVSKHDDDSYYDLWSVKDLMIEGRKRKEVFFASLIIQKGYVGFYFMPVYVETEIKQVFSPGFLKLLKGKSCFHIIKVDEALLEQIEAALKSGFELYEQRGWV
jgi:hypothetical protein